MVWVCGVPTTAGGGTTNPLVSVWLPPRVVQVVDAALDRVAGVEEVLAEVVGDGHLLAARFERCSGHCWCPSPGGRKPATLNCCRGWSGVAEQAHAEVGVGEDEAPEIAAERLDPQPHGDEVVVRGEIAELVLAEELLEGGEAAGARDPLAHVDVDGAIFLGVKVVEVVHAGRPERPVAGPKAGIALEQLERENEVLAEEQLVAAAEDVGAIRIGGADSAGGGNAARLEERVVDRRQVHEDVLPGESGSRP